MDDYDARWESFSDGMRSAGMEQVPVGLEKHFRFGSGTSVTFGEMLRGHIDRLYNQQPNTQYWAPEIILQWMKQTARTAEVEMWRAANTKMASVLKDKVSSGAMTDEAATEFAHNEGAAILEHLLPKKE
jgi:hypothetical protein